MEKYILQVGELSWGKVIMAGLLAAGMYWALWYDNGESIEEAIRQLNSRQAESEKQLRDTKEAMANAEKFEKAVRQNEMQFDKVLEYLPQETNANELTRLINEQAQLSGTRVIQTKPDERVERKEFYEMTRLTFRIQAGFPQVVLFMSSLSKIQKLLTFDSIKLNVSEGTPESPKVELEGTLVGYRYLKEADPSGAAGAGAGGANAPKP